MQYLSPATATLQSLSTKTGNISDKLSSVFSVFPLLEPSGSHAFCGAIMST